MSNGYVVRKLDSLLEGLRPTIDAQEEQPVPKSVAAILAHDDFREAIEKRRAEQAAAEQERQDQREAMELMEELAQALDVPHSYIMDELSRSPEERKAIQADFEKATGAPETHTEQKIRHHEERALEHERNQYPEGAYAEREAAEAIRWQVAQQAQTNSEFEAAVAARYYPQPEGESTDAE